SPGAAVCAGVAGAVGGAAALPEPTGESRRGVRVILHGIRRTPEVRGSRPGTELPVFVEAPGAVLWWWAAGL
ncbi:MAG: hypothetical protein QOD62_1943, partial [Actinomycetota bacterium]|nr:hypothetical protein [Actinomycetota bacterium]